MTSVSSEIGNIDKELGNALHQRRKRARMDESGTRAPVTLTRDLFTAIIKSAAGNTIRNLEAELRRRVARDSGRARELENKVIKHANRIIDLENENLGLKEEIGMMMKEVQSHKEKVSRNTGSERCPESQMRILKAENENLKRDMENLRQMCESETIEKNDKINQLQIRLKEIELNKSRGSLIEREKHLTRIEELVDENAELSKSLVEKETMNNSISDEISALRGTVQVMETSKHSAENLIVLETEKLEAANEEKEKLELMIKQMKKELIQQKETVQNELKRKLQFKSQWDSLKKELLNSQKDSIEKDVHALKEISKKLQGDLQNSEAMYYETMGEQELHKFKEKFTSNEDQIQSLQQVENIRQAQVQTLRSDNVELESKVKDLTEDVESKEKMLLDADEEAEAFKLREAESVKLISALEEKYQEMSESREEQSKGFKKVSDELKLTTEENVGLAERLRIFKIEQDEESAKIEKLQRVLWGLLEDISEMVGA